MSGFADEPREILLPPDEVTLQLRVPTELALVFRRLAKVYARATTNTEAFVAALNEQANI